MSKTESILNGVAMRILAAGFMFQMGERRGIEGT